MKSSLKILIGFGLMGVLLLAIVIMTREVKTIGMNRAVTFVQRAVVRSTAESKHDVESPPASEDWVRVQEVPPPREVAGGIPPKTGASFAPADHSPTKSAVTPELTIKPVSSDTPRKNLLVLDTKSSADLSVKAENAEITAMNPKTNPQEVTDNTAAVKATPRKTVPVLTTAENPKPLTQGIQSTAMPQAANEASLGINPVKEPDSVLDRLKVACDFQSLGVGYKVFQVKKAAVDVLAYTDKGGVGVSFQLKDYFHLGIDNTFKYSNGEQQIRVYLSIPLGAPQ